MIVPIGKMLKKASHIIFTLILLVATTDLVVIRHFCDDFMVSASFYQEAESCCGESSCCHNETESHKLEQMFQVSNPVTIPETNQISLIKCLTESTIDLTVKFVVIQDHIGRKPPSPPNTRTLLSLYQAYLI